MAQVSVRINGYGYTVGCQDGEEDHLLAMAGEVERRIESIKAVAGQAGESRMLVMAALLMADDLFEMEQQIAALERQLADRSRAVSVPAQPDSRLAQRIGQLARRAEEIAAGLEHP